MPPPRMKFLLFILFLITVLKKVGYRNYEYVSPDVLCAEDDINLDVIRLKLQWNHYNFYEDLQ
jgi:hypothetical protein